ncbi:PREDICTED: alpha-tocopherol transfer protein-like [Diuraphis noxia]|uniref:alpha-tocopherol transfer protein-like n=1 Tax=Diuraphis noxia TaxID=143948 RepID=UPI000763892F|nr:PREDICTED: alpha-tocopherol transfer protein-like [Diuraphis noxia]
MISMEKIPLGCEAFLSDLDKLPCLQIGDFKLRLELDDDLSPELLEVAVKELRETPEQQEKSIAELKELLEKLFNIFEDHIYEYLSLFTRSLLNSKSSSFPVVFIILNLYKLIADRKIFLIKMIHWSDLQKQNKKGPLRVRSVTIFLLTCTYLFGFPEKWKHKKCSLDEVYKGAVIFLEAAIMEPATQIAGAQVIFDMDGLSLQQTWQFSPPFAKRIVDWLQDSVPARIKGIHIVNQPILFNVVFNFFKPFLREKLRSRIIFHGTDRVSLHKHLYQPCLPECYGGTLDVPRITGPQWHELLVTVEKEFNVLNNYGYGK